MDFSLVGVDTMGSYAKMFHISVVLWLLMLWMAVKFLRGRKRFWFVLVLFLVVGYVFPFLSLGI